MTSETAPEIITFGCRLNSYESEVMREHAQRAGLRDVVLVNTCAVTSEAVRQARQNIRRLRRENPERTIIVSGCAAQIETAGFAAMPEVDHVIGNDEKLDPSSYRNIAGAAHPSVQAGDIMAVETARHHEISSFSGRARAYVQIQNGCDHRCTFCVIPYGRGNSRSVPADNVIGQIRHLVERGYREIVLTGVDITAYGADLDDKVSLGGLTQKILRNIPDLPRLRLSSIDALETDPALIDAMASEKRLMPHLHLSLQSGDDLILKRMKRRHLREDAIRFCEDLRRVRPEIAFGADLIAGFPTETEEMFANTLRLVDECGLSFLHVFPYSARPGTPAARMPQTDGATIKTRAARLREMGRQALQTHLDRMTGSRSQVLLEKETTGHTPQFAPVRLSETNAAGHIVEVEILGHDNGVLIGREAA